MEGKEKMLSVFEMHKRALQALGQVLINDNKRLARLVRDLDAVVPAISQEEREMVVTIANIIFFLAYCVQLRLGPEPKTMSVNENFFRDAPFILSTPAESFLIEQGIITLASEGFEDEEAPLDEMPLKEKVFGIPPVHGVRVILRDTLVLVQDYAGKTLFVQEHIPKHV